MRLDRDRLAIWLVLALIVAAYIGVPQAGWVWDDQGLIVRNAALTEPSWERVFGKDLWCCVQGVDPSGYYRPLLTVTLLLDRLLFDDDPAGYHAVSVLWHLVATTLAWRLLRDRIGPGRAAVAALVFGMHPLQSEAVVWVAARNDLLAGVGILGALVALDRIALKGRLAIVTACTFAACLSKENAFLLPAIAWIWRRAWGERLTLREGAALLAGLGLALVLRLSADLSVLGVEEHHRLLSVRTAGNALITVLGWFTVPWPLTTTASFYMPTPPPMAWVAAGASLVLLGWLLLRGGTRARWLLAIAAFTYLPALGGIAWYGTIGERYLYVPLFGLAAALAATVPASRASFGALALAVPAAIGVLHVRLPDWADETALFRAAVLHNPDGFSWSLLGTHLAQRQDWPNAARALEQAIQADPPQWRACRHLPTAADHVLDDAAFRTRSAAWLAQGCKGMDFDITLAMALAARQQWDLAEPRILLLGRKDAARREEILRAALALHHGDLTDASRIALDWPGSVSDLVDQASVLARGNPDR